MGARARVCVCVCVCVCVRARYFEFYPISLFCFHKVGAFFKTSYTTHSHAVYGPTGIAVDAAGNVFFADTVSTKRIISIRVGLGSERCTDHMCLQLKERTAVSSLCCPFFATLPGKTG